MCSRERWTVIRQRVPFPRRALEHKIVTSDDELLRRQHALLSKGGLFQNGHQVLRNAVQESSRHPQNTINSGWVNKFLSEKQGATGESEGECTETH